MSGQCRKIMVLYIKVVGQVVFNQGIPVDGIVCFKPSIPLGQYVGKRLNISCGCRIVYPKVELVRKAVNNFNGW